MPLSKVQTLTVLSCKEVLLNMQKPENKSDLNVTKTHKYSKLYFEVCMLKIKAAKSGHQKFSVGLISKVQKPNRKQINHIFLSI